ncbi:MAG: STAS/SEC14 domain-containing protein [Planctomycetota bacterium]
MSVELEQEQDGRILVIRATGKLTKEDYERFVPEFNGLVGRHGKIRIVFEMQDFHGWTAGALWEDTKVDFKHFRDIEKLAMVGDKAWEKGMSVFCKPFTTAEIRYFDLSQVDEARAWIREGLPPASGKTA